MIKHYEFAPLEWDTKYFEVDSARVNLLDIVDQNEQEEITKLCSKYDFVTISNIGNVKENNLWIGRKTKAFLTDMNIQFHKVLSRDPALHEENVCVQNYCPRNEGILKIASESFRYSRFYNDPWLPPTKVKHLYRHWTECAFDKENKYFVVCKKQGSVAGYILFSTNDDGCEIELIAVDKKYQGQGIGRSLIQEMEAYVIDQGLYKIKVGTQLDNISAAQFYSKMGFTYASCVSLYHLWST